MAHRTDGYLAVIKRNFRHIYLCCNVWKLFSRNSCKRSSIKAGSYNMHACVWAHVARRQKAKKRTIHGSNCSDYSNSQYSLCNLLGSPLATFVNSEEIWELFVIFLLLLCLCDDEHRDRTTSCTKATTKIAQVDLLYHHKLNYSLCPPPPLWNNRDKLLSTFAECYEI